MASQPCHEPAIMRRASDISPAEIAALKARVPSAFAAPFGRRALRAFGILAVLLWLALLFWWFDISPSRLRHGLAGLRVILRLMIPPRAGAQWPDILRGLAESVAWRFAARLLPRFWLCL